MFNSTQPLTSVKTNDHGVPKEFALFQNYPNPSNPSTIISYALPLKSNVTMKVYDALGREVRTLVNENQNAGNHTVIFNVSDLPSGVYFTACKREVSLR